MSVRRPVIILLVLLTALNPLSIAAAQSEQQAQGTFTIGNVAPVIVSVDVFMADETTPTTTLTPTQEFAIRVVVQDNNGWDDISRVRVVLLYDSQGNASVGTISFDDPNYQATFEWTPSGGFTLIGPTGSTWAINTTASSATNSSSTELVLWFHVIIGKVAIEADGSNTDWDIIVDVSDFSGATSSANLIGLAMAWYGEISLSTNQVDWGALNLGDTDVGYTNMNTNPVTMTIITNGVSYEVDIRATSPWVGQTTNDNATLSTDTVLSSGEFMLKANTENNTTGAIQVVTTYSALVTNAPGPTNETGDPYQLYMWISVATTGLRPDTYVGTIFVQVIRV